MNALNLQTARVIDPVLTGIAQGYIHAQRVGHILFPTIPVPASGGTVIEFGRESFVNYNSRLARRVRRSAASSSGMRTSPMR